MSNKSSWKFLLLILGLALAACGGSSGSSDDPFGPGLGGDPSKNPCVTDPMGEACVACSEALVACIDEGGTCHAAVQAADACGDACGEDERCSCSSEAMAIGRCLRDKCPKSKQCGGFMFFGGYGA